jgi:predicted secreted protein
VNKAGELLLVKGLKGYEQIDIEVAARTPDANAKARELTDSADTKGRWRSSIKPSPTAPDPKRRSR